MVNTQELLIQRNKELLNKIEELEKKYEPLHNQKAFIERMMEKGDKYRMGLRGDNPWWNNPNDYHSTERCSFFEILTKSGDSHPSYELEPFIWSLIHSHCQLERIAVQRGYFSNKLSKEKDELTSKVANLTESLNHWKPRAEDAEQKVEELEAEVEELNDDVEMEREESMKALNKSDEWHKRKVFELGMKEYSRITELRLKIQELENTLEVKNEKIAKLSKPTKLQKIRKSVKAAKEKVLHTKVVRAVGGKIQEKFCAYVLQSHILQKNK